MSEPAPSTRTRLLRAATDLVAEGGFAAATTAAIAREAGVAEGTLYRHFDSKDALFLAAYREIKQAVLDSVLAHGRDGSDVPERFRQLWRGVWDAYRADPAAFAYGQRFAEYPLAREGGGVVHEGLVSHVGQLIRDGQEAGLIKAMPAPVLSAFFFAPLVAMLKQAAQGRSWSETDLATAIDAAWDSWREIS